MKKLHYAIQQYQKIKLLLVNSQKFTKINRTVKEKTKISRTTMSYVEISIQLRESYREKTPTSRRTQTDIPAVTGPILVAGVDG